MLQTQGYDLELHSSSAGRSNSVRNNLEVSHNTMHSAGFPNQKISLSLRQEFLDGIDSSLDSIEKS